MSPSILIVVSTGNTGAELVRTLPSLLKRTSSLSSHRILAQTRNANGAVAQEFAKIPGVEVVEQDWLYIDAAWLRSHEVERAYIAPQNGPTQFPEESAFHLAALEAGVKYVVRLSTTKSNVGPTKPAFYPRTHWAIENLLSQPEFGALQWTSLQPNIFTPFVISEAVEWVKKYRQTGEKGPLVTFFDDNNNCAVIDPSEVGIVAAHLLAQEDPTPHNQQRYVLAGPSDLNGKQLVQLVEKYSGTKVDDARFRDTSFIKSLEGPGFPGHFIPSMIRAIEVVQDGGSSLEAEPTSEQVAKLYKPKNGAVDALEAALQALEA